MLLSPCLLGACEGKFHIYVKLEQKIDTPKECMGKPVVEWPSCFNSRYYKSPLMLSFEYYSHKAGVDHPSCKDDLHEHVLLGVSFLELYKGGAGFRAIEFRYVRHNHDLKGDATDRDQINKVKLSLQHCDDFYQYLSPNLAFLDGIQNGYIGPVVSFWSRLSDTDSLVF